MTNETRQYTDEYIISIFKQTPKTIDAIITKIEYEHRDLWPDLYVVYTNKGVYGYQYRMKDRWTSTKNLGYYHRIFKIKR